MRSTVQILTLSTTFHHVGELQTLRTTYKKVTEVLACGLLVAGTVHVAKAGAVRPTVTATTGGLGNIPVSIAEDVVSTLLSFLAIALPIVVGTLLIVLAAFIIYWLYRRSNRATT